MDPPEATNAIGGLLKAPGRSPRAAGPGDAQGTPSSDPIPLAVGRNASARRLICGPETEEEAVDRKSAVAAALAGRLGDGAPGESRCSFGAGQALWLALLGITLLACSDIENPTAVPDPSAERRSELAPATDHSLFLRDIPIRPGVTADLHVRMFVNEELPCRDPERTALAIHGINHTAASWENLADAFFAGPARERLCAVAALDHPGHGRSGLPEGDPGITFGELTVEDYARGVVKVMDRLRRRGIRPAVAMGHSQGTQTLQTVQQFLLDEGTSLAERFGVRDVVFFGTQGPGQLPSEWTLPDEAVEEQIASLVTTTPEKGTFVVGPPQVFLENWFINRSLVLSSDAPTLAEIADNGWNEDIPLAAVLQVRGFGGLEPPSVDRGVFSPSSGTRLQMIHFTDDPWSLNAADIYEYLTGDASGSDFTPLDDPQDEAVHDYTITDPGVVRSAVDVPRLGSDRRR